MDSERINATSITMAEITEWMTLANVCEVGGLGCTSPARFSFQA
jgi:hypothetical protein